MCAACPHQKHRLDTVFIMFDAHLLFQKRRKKSIEQQLFVCIFWLVVYTLVMFIICFYVVLVSFIRHAGRGTERGCLKEPHSLMTLLGTADHTVLGVQKSSEYELLKACVEKCMTNRLNNDPTIVYFSVLNPFKII